ADGPERALRISAARRIPIADERISAAPERAAKTEHRRQRDLTAAPHGHAKRRRRGSLSAPRQHHAAAAFDSRHRRRGAGEHSRSRGAAPPCFGALREYWRWTRK